MEIELSALGLGGAQLPEVQINGLKDQFKLYPDQPSFTDSTPDGQTIEGTRSQTFVLIASAAGALEIPEIRVAWWDRNKKQQQYASLPAVKVDVIASAPETPTITAPATPIDSSKIDATPTAAPTHPERTNGVNPAWKWISLASLSGWLLSLVYLLFFRSTTAGKSAPYTDKRQTMDLRPLLKKIRTAAEENQAPASWQALQDYARAHWPEHPPKTREDWERRLAQPHIRTVIAQLEGHLFRNQKDAEWNGAELRNVVVTALPSAVTLDIKPAKQTVPGLYPEA